MKLLFIPPDTRPPTLDFPVALAQAVGLNVAVPPAEALPYLNQPGNLTVLAEWLESAAEHADTLIVCLETLTLGGMIPARRVDDPLETALRRLELLPHLKAQFPALTILAHGVVVRVAHGDDPIEEKPYYGRYGPDLRRYSEAFDRYTRRPDTELKGRLEAAEKALPPDILNNWLATRRRNHALHLRALDLTHAGVIEHLCLTLDDTSPYGLAAVDRRALEARTDTLELWPNVDIYPGADEVPVTLLARVISPEPTPVFVRYSGTLGAAAGLKYEDRPAGELVKAQLRAANCYGVKTPADAAFILAVNTPGRSQSEPAPDIETVDTADRHLPEFVDFIGRMLGAGKTVSVADIAYPNGAEARFFRMVQGVGLGHLAGFSAWNTAGNTLGSAVALGVAAAKVKDQARWTELRFNRLVDDALYQGEVRTELFQALGNPSPFDLGEQHTEAEALLNKLLEPRARALWDAHFAGTGYRLEWHPPTLPWPRLFTGRFPFKVV